MGKKVPFGLCVCGSPATQWLDEGIHLSVCDESACKPRARVDNQERAKKAIEELDAVWPA